MYHQQHAFQRKISTQCIFFVLVILVAGYVGLTFIGWLTPVEVSCLSSAQVAELRQLSPQQFAILSAAKERTTHKVNYKSTYYTTNGGKPPDNEGVCTDLFWRSLEGAAIDFPQLLAKDMQQRTPDYPLSIWRTSKTDPLIDYRRVPNIHTYLEKYAEKLSLNLTACDMSSIRTWKPADIVVFRSKPGSPPDHIAIVSDKHDALGIPYLIHNYGVGEVEQPGIFWFPFAAGHYRWQ